MTGLTVMATYIDTIAKDPNDEYIRVRWRCPACDRSHISRVAKSTVEGWSVEGVGALNRECFWCKTMNIIEVRVV